MKKLIPITAVLTLSKDKMDIEDSCLVWISPDSISSLSKVGATPAVRTIVSMENGDEFKTVETFNDIQMLANQAQEMSLDDYCEWLDANDDQ